MSLNHCAAIIVTVFFFLSCGDLHEFDRSRVKAPEIIGESFVIDKKYLFTENSGVESTPAQTNQIGIKVSSLDKEFLLQGSLIFKAVVGRFKNLKSKIVAFKVVDDNLYMLEASHGHTISSDISQGFVLAKFPITRRTDEFIYFDFAEGMSKIFIASDWRGQDLSGGHYPNDSWDSLPIETSYIKSADIDAYNNLVISQIAQAFSSGVNQQKKIPIEVKYYLTPYKENLGFESTVSKNFDKMGFFEIAPQLRHGGGEVIYASKFDYRKPIVYAISSNTPEEYKDAIRSGVLYWNKAFGRDVIRVIEAPDGVAAPNFKYNIIQWVDWNDAGFAYADAQMDPRTGEILHAQVFLTSVFAFSSKRRARDLLNRLMSIKNHTHGSKNASFETYLDDMEEDSTTHSSYKISLKGFEKESMCDYHPSQSMLAGLTSLLTFDGTYDDSVYLKVSKDYVREVVAHEVGHTLGLRHNFAGSLYANFDVLDKDEIFLDYIKRNRAPDGIVTTSSVMEYQSFEESVITGDQLLTESRALDYDQVVIGSLYLGNKYAKINLPPFCTDSHRSKYLDCQVFDSGKSIYKSSLRKEKNYKDILPFLLLDRYVAAKPKVESGDIESLGAVTLDPLMFVVRALSGRLKVLDSFSTSSSFLQVRRQFPFINSLNRQEVQLAKASYILQGLDEVGGLNQLFKLTSSEEILQLKNKFNSLLEEVQKREGLYEGSLFTPEEIKLIKSQTDQFFRSLATSYTMADLIYFNKAKNLMGYQFSNDLLALMFQRVAQVIFTGIGIKEYTVGEVTVKIPTFLFPFEVRSKVSMLLRSKSNDILWGLKERNKIKNSLTLLMKNTLGEDLLKMDMMTFPDDLIRWILENKAVLRSL